MVGEIGQGDRVDGRQLVARSQQHRLERLLGMRVRESVDPEELGLVGVVVLAVTGRDVAALTEAVGMGRSPGDGELLRDGAQNLILTRRNSGERAGAPPDAALLDRESPQHWRRDGCSPS